MTIARGHHGLLMGGGAMVPQDVVWTSTGSGVVTESGRLWTSPVGASNSWYKARIDPSQFTGNWYIEIQVVDAPVPGVVAIGIARTGTSINNGQGGSNNAGDGNRHQYFGDGRRRSAGTYSAYGDTFGPGDFIGIGLVKLGSSNQITAWKNGVSQGVMFSPTDSNNQVPHVCCYNSATCALRVRAFAKYLPPGYTIWN